MRRSSTSAPRVRVRRGAARVEATPKITERNGVLALEDVVRPLAAALVLDDLGSRAGHGPTVSLLNRIRKGDGGDDDVAVAPQEGRATAPVLALVPELAAARLPPRHFGRRDRELLRRQIREFRGTQGEQKLLGNLPFGEERAGIDLQGGRCVVHRLARRGAGIHGVGLRAPGSLAARRRAGREHKAGKSEGSERLKT